MRGVIPRYSREEMAAIFSERAKFSRWLEIEILAVEARVRLGEVPVDDLTEIKDEGGLRRGSHRGDRGRPSPRCRRFRRERPGERRRGRAPHPLRHDLFRCSRYRDRGGPAETRAICSSRASGKLDRDRDAEGDRAPETPSWRRPHPRHSRRADDLRAEAGRLGLRAGAGPGSPEARPRPGGGREASGAVGTYSQLCPRGRVLRLRSTWPGGRARCDPGRRRAIATRSSSPRIATTGASLERFAQEIRHLQRTEVGRPRSPSPKGQKGSSAMPHKRNPIVCERICGLARLLRPTRRPDSRTLRCGTSATSRTRRVERVDVRRRLHSARLHARQDELGDRGPGRG